jgi:hypothetical protein
MSPGEEGQNDPQSVPWRVAETPQIPSSCSIYRPPKLMLLRGTWSLLEDTSMRVTREPGKNTEAYVRTRFPLHGTFPLKYHPSSFNITNITSK